MNLEEGETEALRIRAYFYEALFKCEKEDPAMVAAVIFGLLGIYIGNFVTSEEEARVLVNVIFDEGSEKFTLQRVLEIMNHKQTNKNENKNSN